jgi:non-ribosomal peptide synthetase component F
MLNRRQRTSGSMSSVHRSDAHHAHGAGGTTTMATVDQTADLFDAATIARIAGHFRTLLGAVLADPATRLGDLPVLTPAELLQLDARHDGTAPAASDSAPEVASAIVRMCPVERSRAAT